jgi:hypothetical protein
MERNSQPSLSVALRGEVGKPSETGIERCYEDQKAWGLVALAVEMDLFLVGYVFHIYFIRI